MKHEAPARRKYDDSDPTALASYAHDRLDRIEPKLDEIKETQHSLRYAILKNQWIAAGAATAIMFLSTHPDLLRVISPSQAAEVEHGRP